MNKRRRRRPKVYEYDFGRCKLTIEIVAGKVKPTLRGELPWVPGGDRERVADLLARWTGERHDDCYEWCWAGIPRRADASQEGCLNVAGH